MNRHRLFWGILIILLGVMLLLNTFGILTINAWQIFWPLILVLAGGWLLIGPFIFRRSQNPQNVTVPLEGAPALKVKVNHGAGRMHIGPAPKGSRDALSGVFVGGVEANTHMSGSELKIRLKTPSDFFWGFPPLSGFEGFSWDFNLNQDVPLRLVIRSGANESTLDLRDLKVTDLSLETGASSTQIIMPSAAGFTSGTIQTGASSVQIQVPDGVAGHFEIKHGLAGIQVDTTRFANSGNIYETPGFASYPNRIQMTIETGVGSIEIR